MIYLENTTQSQQVYIPRQVIQTATTREINIITSGDVINMIDSKLEPYYTSAETDTQIENACGIESARCEETYAKIEDIPDVSEFITSGDAQEQINQSLDGYATEQWVEDKHYLTEHQSLSAYSTTEEMNSAISAATDDMATKTWVEDKHYLTEHQSLSAYSTTEQVEGMIANESARTEETYAKPSDIPDVSDFVDSGDVQTQIDNNLSAYTKTNQFATINGSGITNGGNIVIQGGGGGQEYYAGENIDITDNVISVTGITIPDVSNFVTSADVKTQVEGYNYVNSGDVKEQIEDYHYITSASLPDVSDFITSADAKTQIDESIGAESARCEETYAKPADIPSVDDFVTSADVKSQVEAYNYVTSGDVEGQITDRLADYPNNEEVQNAIDYSAGELSGWVQENYAEKTDIPDVSDFVTSADVETQITNKNYVNSGQVKTQIEGYKYVNSGDVKTQIDTALEDYVSNQSFNDFLENEYGPALGDLWDNFANYSPTDNFATINGSAITEGGNIQIDIPDVSDFVTSADVETQITGKNYVTSADVETQITNKHYITSADAKTQIEAYHYVNDEDFGSFAEYVLDGLNERYTSAQTNTAIENAIGTESARCESTYVKSGSTDYISKVSFKHRPSTAVSYDYIAVEDGTGDLQTVVPLSKINGEGLLQNVNFILPTSADVETQITDRLADYPNNEEVQNAIDYSAGELSGWVQENYAEKTDIPDVSDFVTSADVETQIEAYGYATTGDVQTLSGNVQTALDSKYAPSTAGSAGQVVMSNGSGMPSWSSFKFWKGTKSQYDAIQVKDDDTIYFVKPD